MQPASAVRIAKLLGIAAPRSTAARIGEGAGSRKFDVRKRDKTAYRSVLRADPCAYCGQLSEALDHIEPKAEGGDDDWTNRAAVCRECNSIKGQLSILQALLFIPPTREYHRLRRVLYH